MSCKFWDRDSVRYAAPFELEDGELSSRVQIGGLDLRKGAKLAYLFDYGDEWRVLLHLVDTWEAGYPMLMEAEGTAPPQYPPLDENDD